MSVRLLVVDDQPVSRAGVRGMLEGGAVEVVGEYGTITAAAAAVIDAAPDLVLAGSRISGEDGVALIAKLRDRGCPAPVLYFSGQDNPTYVARAMAAGAAGYLLKTAGREQLLSAIETAAGGGDCWTVQDRKRHTGALPADLVKQHLEVTLTKRESEVLKQLSFGLTNKEIASALGLRYDTVKEHVQHVLRKLAVNDRTQAAVLAVRKGLV